MSHNIINNNELNNESSEQKFFQNLPTSVLPNMSSNKSITSIGIGTNTSETGTGAKPKSFKIELIKPKAENCLKVSEVYSESSSIYDCIVFLIYCAEHDRFAVTKVSQNPFDKIIWMPFVVRDNRSWCYTTELELQSMFTKHDADDVVVDNVTIAHKFKMIELCHMQAPSGRWIQRATQFVTITKCKQTCDPVNSLEWVDAGQIFKDDDSTVWGPEFRQYLVYLEKKNYELKIVEYSLEKISHIYENEKNPGFNLLKSLVKSRNVTQKLMLELYDHYLKHTFPSYFMNFGSFRIYLAKCGLKNITIKNHAQKLFQCCLTRPKRECLGQTYLDFFDICFLLIGLDPELPNDKYRQKFIQHYLETCQVLKENLSNEFRVKKYDSKSKSICDLNSDFIVQLPKSMFNRLGISKKKKERLVSDKSSLTRGICRNCCVKQFEYGQHCIMYDSMARCVEPKIILNADNQFTPIHKLEEKKLYSAEYVFKLDSIGNALFDYIRNRKFLLVSNNNKTGEQQAQALLPAQSEVGNACSEEKMEDYLINAILNICDYIQRMLKYESKLIKRSGPTVVIGDIKGNLDLLLSLEQMFWPSMPVIPLTLIFLGNYISGKKGVHNIETIIYLFAIKYICPNKIVLLKGIEETRAMNEKTLLIECKTRYGEERGKLIWNSINYVFDEMPLVSIINESIVCTSSGIPKEGIKHKITTLFDGYILETQKLITSKSINQTVKDCPQEFAIYQQILMNIPDIDSNTNIIDERKQNKSCKGASTLGTNKVSQMQEQLILFRPRISNTKNSKSNAYIFTREAFKQFMDINQFKYMIRSNDTLQDGYRLSFCNRLITIDSSSNEQEPNQQGLSKNKSCVVFIQHPNSRIQLIEFDSYTTNSI